MNAVRIRKENQVYSAEEQRALAMYNYEERANRESQLISDLKEMLSEFCFDRALAFVIYLLFVCQKNKMRSSLRKL